MKCEEQGRSIDNQTAISPTYRYKILSMQSASCRCKPLSTARRVRAHAEERRQVRWTSLVLQRGGVDLYRQAKGGSVHAVSFGYFTRSKQGFGNALVM